MVAPTARLRRWLSTLSNDNAQGEYYLTDIVAHGGGRRRAGGRRPQPSADWESLGVNSKVQLAELERVYQRNMADAAAGAGRDAWPTRRASTCAAR